jgi:Ser/Thr protein kinase RdoA (MazF antagonist)
MTPPTEVLAAWGWDRDVEVAPLTGGLINATYAVRRDGAPIAVVQRLHPVFAGPVNLDLDAVTCHLAARGLVTPRLIRTLADDAWIEHDGVWRALTWVDGETVHAVPDATWAAAGGELVGRFHRAVADLEHEYRFTRAGVHDTAAHLARLRAALAAPETPDQEVARALAAEILGDAAGLPPLPRRRRATATATSRSRTCSSRSGRRAASRSSISTPSTAARWRSSSGTRCAPGATPAARIVGQRTSIRRCSEPR